MTVDAAAFLMEVGTSGTQVFSRLRAEYTDSTEGIRFFGITYALDYDDVSQEEIEDLKQKFRDTLDHTVSVMLYSHYYLGIFRERTFGPNVLELSLEASVATLPEVGEGMIAPDSTDIRRISAYSIPVPLKVDLDKVTLKLLTRPYLLELFQLPVDKKRFMACACFTIEFAD